MTRLVLGASPPSTLSWQRKHKHSRPKTLPTAPSRSVSGGMTAVRLGGGKESWPPLFTYLSGRIR